MKNVCVLLASYNGEKWIKNQLRTILNQKKISLDLFISDDCSIDNTLKIIKKFQRKIKIFFYGKTKKIKICNSKFLNLLQR